MILLSIIISIIFLSFFSFFEIEEKKEKNIEIKPFNKNWWYLINEYYLEYFLITILSGSIFLFYNFNINLPFILYGITIFFLFVFILDIKILFKKHIEKEMFLYKIKRKKYNNELLIYYSIFYLLFILLYYIFKFDITLFLIIPFIIIVNFLDIKYGHITNIIIIPFILIIGYITYIEKSYVNIPFGFFIFGFSLLLIYKILPLFLVYIGKIEKGESLLGGSDIIILYLLILGTNIKYGFLFIVLLPLTLIINKFLNRNKNKREPLFKFLIISFYIGIIFYNLNI